MTTFDFVISSDYRMIYLEDISESNQSSAFWTEEDVKRNIFVEDCCVIIQTARDYDSNMKLLIVNDKPEIDYRLFDHINMCSINVPSNVLSIHGTTYFIGEYNKINLPNKSMGLLIAYRNIHVVSKDNLNDIDEYHVYSWPINGKIELKVLKQSNNG